MFSLTAQAQTGLKYIEVPTSVHCAETPDVIKELQNTHKEYPVMIGKAENLLMVVWKETQKGNFTITLSSLDGKMTCLLTAGTHLRTVTEKGL